MMFKRDIISIQYTMDSFWIETRDHQKFKSQDFIEWIPSRFSFSQGTGWLFFPTILF